jgi:uncharacterized protein YjgD (DUF1641 family)
MLESTPGLRGGLGASSHLNYFRLATRFVKGGEPMAQPIPLEAPGRDLRRERAARLESAGIDHAEALLDAYELLEKLHETRTLELLRGALGARDRLTETVAASLDTPQAVNGLRNLILLAKMLGSIDPEVMESCVSAVAEAAGQMPDASAEPPGLFALLGRFRRREVRRALAFLNRFLELLGAGLGRKRAAAQTS